MSSHRDIHYGLRPAKNVERKMIFEALQRLTHFENLNKYRYVGFGSRYFSDFILIHKTLGIHQLISIEQEGTNQEWFEFNKPYGCINPIFKHSNFVLPDLDWKPPTILWLDYDGKLDTRVFSDIMSFCGSAVAGSILLITVNADGGDFTSLEDRLNEFTTAVGESRVPTGTKAIDLSKKNTPKLLREIIDREIQEQLSIRNRVLPTEENLIYQQLFNFVYEDGAQMLTVGGIIFRDDQRSTIEKCAFADFNYICETTQSFKIEVPNLTFREIHYLNQLLPFPGDPPQLFIPPKEIAQYSKIYRYFPAFTEAEV